MPTFKEEKYGAPETQVVKLNRKQIESMHEMIGHFKDIDNFELHITNASGIGTSMNFKFNIDLTDVDKW